MGGLYPYTLDHQGISESLVLRPLKFGFLWILVKRSHFVGRFSNFVKI
jgi:hypothetical protein